MGGFSQHKEEKIILENKSKVKRRRRPREALGGKQGKLDLLRQACCEREKKKEGKVR